MKKLSDIYTNFDHNLPLTPDDIIFKAYMDVEQVEKYFTYEYAVGNEFLLSLTKNILTSVFDTIFWIGNNAKTFFKSYRDLKRSELREYKESAFGTHMRILKLDFKDIRAEAMPLPRGMIGTYLEGALAIDKLLSALDMARKAAVAADIVGTIHAGLEDKVRDTKQSVNFLNTQEIGAIKLFDIKQILKIKAPYDKLFTQKPTAELRFDALFKSMEDFKAVDKKLLEMEAYLISVSSVGSKLEKIEKHFMSLISLLDTKKLVLSKKELEPLAHVSLMFAQCFDLFGDACETLTRLEHNFVICLRKLEVKL
jgi:hypothetical protein